MLSNLPYISIIFIAFGGVLLAAYIRHKKQAQEKMVCPLKADCEAVIYSDFASFFGVPIELLGIFYYTVVALSYAVFVVAPQFVSPQVSFAVLILTTGAFLFSGYLTFVQAFTIKQWCTWCLMSAGLSTLIFILAVSAAMPGLLALLVHNHLALVAIQMLGLALGVGGATINSIFFARFLRDFRLAAFEVEVLRILTQVIWIGLAVIIVSGIGLYLPQMTALNSSAIFLAQATIVVIIMINNALLHLIIEPRLISVSLGGEHEHHPGEMRRLRQAALMLVAVSLVSWYTVLILSVIEQSFNSYVTLMLVYLVAIVTALGMSQLVERSLVKHS